MGWPFQLVQREEKIMFYFVALKYLTIHFFAGFGSASVSWPLARGRDLRARHDRPCQAVGRRKTTLL